MAIRYDSTPVVGYGEGLVISDRKEEADFPAIDADGNNWMVIVDAVEFNVHPYREDLGGYPVRWILQYGAGEHYLQPAQAELILKRAEQ
jgi:hypothetical protein